MVYSAEVGKDGAKAKFELPVLKEVLKVEVKSIELIGVTFFGIASGDGYTKHASVCADLCPSYG